MEQKQKKQEGALKERKGKKEKEKRGFFSELAVVSFILGILSFVFPLFGPLAIILGIGGLMQIRRLSLRGGTLAVLGIVLGILVSLALIVMLAFGMGYLEQYGGISGLMGRIRK